VKVGQTGLVLTGGGARSAYQVGALRALAEITKTHYHHGFTGNRRGEYRFPDAILLLLDDFRQA